MYTHISLLLENLDSNKAKRLEALEEEMTLVNAEYIRAVNRASAYCFSCCCASPDFNY